MKKILFVTLATAWMLAGCNSSKTACNSYTTQATCPETCTWTGDKCQETKPSQCSDITDPELCAVEVAGGGCYWTGSACALTTACSQPTSGKSCLSTTVSGTTCYWSGTTCSTSKPAQTVDECSDVSNETLCNQQTFPSSTCAWNDTSKQCAQAATCEAAVTEQTCLATSEPLAADVVCNWNNNTCYRKTTLTCSATSGQASCQATFASDGTCSWDNSNGTCAATYTCSSLDSEATCNGNTMGGKACKWIPTAASCIPNNPGLCTANTGFTECCAGSSRSCTTTDANCVKTSTGIASQPISCGYSATPSCTLNKDNPIQSLVNRSCCSGTSTTCSSTNENCVYASATGSCQNA